MTFDEQYEAEIAKSQTLDDLALVLQRLLQGHSVWHDGHLNFIKRLVDTVDGLKIKVFPIEHPPPHFHVTAADIDVVFAIEDGRLLRGKLGGRELKIVAWWYQRSRPKLISIWNATRPSDCPVGPISL